MGHTFLWEEEGINLTIEEENLEIPGHSRTQEIQVGRIIPTIFHLSALP